MSSPKLTTKKLNRNILIILGAKTEADGTPSPSLQRRLDRAIALHHATSFDVIIVSGGATNPHHDQTEAQIMARTLINRDIPRELISIEPQARNTLENSVFCTPFFTSKDKITVVSDLYHLPRVKLCFSALGYSAKLKATGLWHRHMIIGFAREFPALLWYMFRLIKGDHRTLMAQLSNDPEDPA